MLLLCFRGESLRFYCIGSRVGLETGMDVVENRNISFVFGLDMV